MNKTGARFGIIPIKPVARLEKAIIIRIAIITKLKRKDFSSPFTSFSFMEA